MGGGGDRNPRRRPRFCLCFVAMCDGVAPEYPAPPLAVAHDALYNDGMRNKTTIPNNSNTEPDHQPDRVREGDGAVRAAWMLIGFFTLLILCAVSCFVGLFLFSCG